MKIERLHRVTILVLLTIAFGLSSMTHENEPKKEYRHSSGKEFSNLILKSNGRFKLRMSSCTYSLEVIGDWESRGDTIVLNRKKVRKGKIAQFDERYNRYVMMPDQSLQNVWFREKWGEWFSLNPMN